MVQTLEHYSFRPSTVIYLPVGKITAFIFLPAPFRPTINYFFELYLPSLLTQNDDCLQKYLSLQNQKEQLLQKSSIAFTCPFAASPPEWSSTQSTPMGFRSGYDFPPSYHESHPTSTPTSYPAPTHTSRARSVSDPDVDNENSRALYHINQQIKAALTELLNTDSVRTNDNYRMFVQGKLMDAEMEMKGQRRRRSSEASSVFLCLVSSPIWTSAVQYLRLSLLVGVDGIYWWHIWHICDESMEPRSMRACKPSSSSQKLDRPV
ncbi:hypothetical protein EJ05DRAFT_318114 [Pseudovirgaria hyperparasitica]|uniref:Uncharacterized protein n=1 Tax=Pseudovirgaria hyperparasitica TaxID=470096 RepID=A0A6A6WBD7_9PEZI|nr:uncharacterized protein EJ05DRAFT_318114 [Pseudovirgaria hyperparasitica]KAF2759993.1 hypothetical protein EJ05DRAFT_318114 [Pseudovirgaria hyperparasitica]